MSHEPIDFAVTWVDGNDPDWQKERIQWQTDKLIKAGDISSIDDRKERYRDYDLMKYWFRGVEKYAPWVHNIYFITHGHLPQWLDTSNPKLKIISHKDYMPADSIPCFNSNAIELGLHKIKGISEHFVYFNDDFFPVRPLKEEDFFKNGLPCDMLAFQPVVANPANPVMSHGFLNNALVIAKHFDKRANVKKQPGKYFKIGYPPMYFCYNLLELAFPKYTGFYTVHGPYPFLKSTFETVWDKESDVLMSTVRNRFRSKDDLTLYMLRDWQKLEGNFHPHNLHRDFSYYELSDNNDKLISAIKKPKKKIICINDGNKEIDFERTKNQLQQAFESLLPEKSSFEK